MFIEHEIKLYKIDFLSRKFAMENNKIQMKFTPMVVIVRDDDSVY